MPLTDFYEQYRLELTGEDNRLLGVAQRSRAQMAPDPNRPHYFVNADGESVLDPVIAMHKEIAERRAASQFHFLMPEDESVCIRYPSIDPMGKYSPIDMGFAQRFAAVQARLQFCSRLAQNNFEDLCRNLGLPEPMFDEAGDIRAEAFATPLYTEMRKACEDHRRCTRAAKLARDDTARELLLAEARDLQVSPAVERFDRLLQGMEYVVGLRPGPASEEVADLYRELGRGDSLNPYYLDAAAHVERPERIEVRFQDLRHRTYQQILANPRNWDKTGEELQEIVRDSLDVDKIMGGLSSYTTSTVKRVIDPAFREAERDRGNIFDRADLIIVDGRTVREIMEEKFTSSGREGTFADFYRQNREQMTNDLVAAGLMAGKRVEAFIPGRDGTLPDEPTPLVQSGYAPTSAEPEHFNAWQRFFSKRGFYKEKLARQAEYERAMAARDRVKQLVKFKELPSRLQRYDAGDDTGVNRDMFFASTLVEMGLSKQEWDEKAQRMVDRPDYDQAFSHLHQHGAEGAFLKFGRSEAVSTCICFMALQGHKFKDIMDPNKLQEERHAAAQLFMAKGEANDEEWLGRVFYHGHKALLKEVDELTKGVDLRDEEQLTSILPELLGMTDVGFSVSQTLAPQACRIAYLKEGIREMGGNVELGCQRASQLDNTVNDSCVFPRRVMRGMLARAKMATSLAGPGEDLLTQEEIRSVAMERILHDQVKEGRSFTDRVPSYVDVSNMGNGLAVSNMGDQLQEFLNAPENRLLVKGMAASGTLTQAMSVQHQAVPVENGIGDTMYTLESNDEGELVSKPVVTPRMGMDHHFQLHLTAPRLMQELFPQQAARQPEAPQQQAPQQQAPQQQALQQQAPQQQVPKPKAKEPPQRGMAL